MVLQAEANDLAELLPDVPSVWFWEDQLVRAIYIYYIILYRNGRALIKCPEV